MKVAYDMSVLGLGYINPKARTGIFRVTEQVLLELVHEPSLDLRLMGLHQGSTLWEAVSSWLYLDASLPLAKDKFLPLYPAYTYPLCAQAVKLQKILIQRFYGRSQVLYKLALALQIPFKLLSKGYPVDSALVGKVDLYHSPFWALPESPVLRGVPKVLTVYDLIPILFPEFVTENIRQKFHVTMASLKAENAWVICDSENTRQDLCHYIGIPQERTFVTPLAASDTFYPVQDGAVIRIIGQKYGIPEASYCLSLATLEPRKNLDFLIRCFGNLLRSQPNLDLNLVLVGGSGWKYEKIYQAIEDSGVRSRIILTGHVPDADLSALYSGATAFVYPSLYEGFGLPPLEAMQCGIPVITSNNSSLPEVVGDAGILIDPTDQDGVCQAILTVVNDSGLRSDLAQKGLARAQTFSWARCAAETVKVYQTAIAAQ